MVANPDVSVVVPLYNSERTIKDLVAGLRAVFTELDRTYELVFVDDASADGTWGTVRELINAGEPIHALQFTRNHGQHYALKCGLDHSKGDLVVIMDDDLQHPPEEVATLIRMMDANPEIDVVTGRYDTKRHHWMRNLGSWLVRTLQRRIFRSDRGIYMSSFAVMRKSVVDEIRQVRHAQPRIQPIVLSITGRIQSVDVRHDARSEGRSGYTVRKLVRDTFDSVMNYSALPLQIVSVVGIGASLLSVVLAIFYLIRYFTNNIEVDGFTTIVVLILFTSGAVLFSFGLVGEYLRRIVSQQLMAAQYHIAVDLKPDSDQDSTTGSS